MGPSLDVGRVWTKINDNAPINEMCWLFLIYAQIGQFWKDQVLTNILSSSSLPQKTISLKYYYNIISMPWAPTFFFLLEHLFCLSHHKLGWIMLVDNNAFKHVLWGLGTPWSPWHLFPWYKPKWSRDEVNSQSQILRGLGTTSCSMMYTTPYRRYIGWC